MCFSLLDSVNSLKTDAMIICIFISSASRMPSTEQVLEKLYWMSDKEYKLWKLKIYSDFLLHLNNVNKTRIPFRTGFSARDVLFGELFQQACSGPITVYWVRIWGMESRHVHFDKWSSGNKYITHLVGVENNTSPCGIEASYIYQNYRCILPFDQAMSLLDLFCR